MTGETTLKPVTALIFSEGRHLYAIALLEQNGKITRIEASDNHPFWVNGRGWIDSAQLKRGMKVSNFEKKTSTVVNVEDLGRTDSTYNLTVADFHTFFAGDGRAFVHNVCACDLVVKDVPLSRATHGEAAEHAADAIAAGKPSILTIERPGAPANRKASIGALDKVPAKHLDEYPPAMFKEGGSGASVRAINPRDNMSAGACIGNACRGLPNGAKIRITVGD